MALAAQFEDLLREGTVKDCADLARLGADAHEPGAWLCAVLDRVPGLIS
jgi:hypothetical protein